MTKGGQKRGRGGLTPEQEQEQEQEQDQEQERFSTGGLGFEQTLRPVVVGGPDDGGPHDHQEGEEDDVTEGTATEASPAIDLEILDRLAGFERVIIDGTIEELPPVREQLRGYLSQRGL